jgi:hypothetical protein
VSTEKIVTLPNELSLWLSDGAIVMGLPPDETSPSSVVSTLVSARLMPYVRSLLADDPEAEGEGRDLAAAALARAAEAIAALADRDIKPGNPAAPSPEGAEPEPVKPGVVTDPVELLANIIDQDLPRVSQARARVALTAIVKRLDRAMFDSLAPAAAPHGAEPGPSAEAWAADPNAWPLGDVMCPECEVVTRLDTDGACSACGAGWTHDENGQRRQGEVMTIRKSAPPPSPPHGGPDPYKRGQEQALRDYMGRHMEAWQVDKAMEIVSRIVAAAGAPQGEAVGPPDMMPRCPSTCDGDRCDRIDGHKGSHTLGSTFWIVDDREMQDDRDAMAAIERHEETTIIAPDGYTQPPASPHQGSAAPRADDALLVCASGCGTTPHRFRPSPEAGPHWRCSECGEVTPAGKVLTEGGMMDQRALFAARFGDPEPHQGSGTVESPDKVESCRVCREPVLPHERATGTSGRPYFVRYHERCADGPIVEPTPTPPGGQDA